MIDIKISQHVKVFIHSSAASILPVLALGANLHHHGAMHPPPPPQDLPADPFALAAQAATPPPTYPHVWELIYQQFTQGGDLTERVLYLAAGVLTGGLLGAFFSDRFRRWRKLIGLAILGICLTGAALAHNLLAFGIGFGVAAVVVYRLLKDRLNFLDEAIYGNAHPAEPGEIAAAGYTPMYDVQTQSYGPEKPGIPVGFVV